MAALGIYMGYVGCCRILWPGFAAQVVLAILLALVSIAAVIPERPAGTARGNS